MLAVAVAAGCGKTDDKKAASQVAAKVNSDEITVYQINGILAVKTSTWNWRAGKAPNS